MAKVALDDLLQRIGAAGALAGNCVAEWDGRPATAVERAWNHWAATGAGKPHIRVAANVRDMLRCGARPLRRMLGATPRGAMLLI
eukprot:8128357-Lingulodinium_polyedra.AAC.1